MSDSSSPSSHILLGIDAGGTFTDFVLYKEQAWSIHKVLSTPANPAKAILQGISELGLDDDVARGQVMIVHGSTVATNAALERKGAKTAYVANTGFKDVLTIGRQARRELYNLFPDAVAPPVAKELCLEVNCRRDAKGDIILPLKTEEIHRLRQQLAELDVEAVAINLLFSFLNSEEEERLEAALQSDFFVSRSSNVLPKYKEYERGMATWLNASLGSKVNQYMTSLLAELHRCPLSVMQSSGGTISAEQAANRAVNLLLSGPAGGLCAVKHIADECQISRVMSFDMGGTSTDVALMDENFRLTDEGHINDWPVAIPMLEMETIGAGGGSIAWVDKGGMLHVGPESAGSNPGPVCYGLGGTQPTVTDANLVLGKLQAESFLGGKMKLDYDAAFNSLAQLSEHLNMTVLQLAEGIITLAEEHMAKALRAISVQRGYNPSQFTLCCFGGAGGMHVCSLAEKMGASRALVPARSGVLSAYGMLTADKQRQFSKTHICLLEEIEQSLLETFFTELEHLGFEELKQEAGNAAAIETERSLDLRYQGQSFSLNIADLSHPASAFEAAHEKQYGHRLQHPIELVNICVQATVRATKPQTERIPKSAGVMSSTITQPFTGLELKLVERGSLSAGDIIEGPAVISEHVSTTWLQKGWLAEVDQYGHLHLHDSKAS